MEQSLQKFIKGYRLFREKYTQGEASVMQQLAEHGQFPQAMIVSCCDSRVDPALILQSHPGDLFVVRNIANIVPPYHPDGQHHGTSAALEFGICYLNVKHLIILGHSQCAGIQRLLANDNQKNDFIDHWVASIPTNLIKETDANLFAQEAILHSYQNCLTFPWIKQRVQQHKLLIHSWFFDIKNGEISAYSDVDQCYRSLIEE